MTEQQQVQRPVRRSGWRIALHCWAGICLKAAADVSGIFAIRGGPDIESARIASSGAGMIAAFLIVTGYYLSYQLASALDKSSLSPKVRKITLILLPIVYFVGAILLGGMVDLMTGTAR